MIRLHSTTSGASWAAAAAFFSCPGARADPDDGGEREAEPARHDVGVEAGDDAGLLKPRQALRNGGGGEADAAPELGHRDPPVLLSSASIRPSTGSTDESLVIWLNLRRSTFLNTQNTSFYPCSSVNMPANLLNVAKRIRTLTDAPPPHAYFVVSAVFHYLGPAFAVLLFARVGVLGVAWLRIASAAVIFAVWLRPWRLYASLGTRRPAPAARLGRSSRGHERLLLRGHCQASAWDRGRD